MAERELFAGELVDVVEFACPPGDDAWRDVNTIESGAPIVVFPRVPVMIRPVGGEPVLATPNLVMLYNPGQLYERELRSTQGDACLYVRLLPAAVEALECDGGAVRNGRLLSTQAPSSRLAYLHQHLLARHLRDEAADPLLAEETALRLVRTVVLPSSPPRGGRSATRSAHRALTEAAKELVAATVTQSLALDELASRLRASPFHLARVFRRETGFSLHEYRTQLRLRMALERIDAPLAEVALDCGFASHSHFTDTFRRAFGIAPSALRDRKRLTSRITEAMARLPE